MKNRLNLNIPESIKEIWQNTVDVMAKALNVPAALIMRVDDGNLEVFCSSNSIGNVYETGHTEILKSSGLYCEYVINNQKMLKVNNALESEIWNNNPDIKVGMISYLGFPINWPNNIPFGTICVLDNKSSDYTDDNIKFLDQMRVLIELSLKGIYDNILLEDAKKELELKNDKLNSYVSISNKFMKMVHFYEDGEIESCSSAFNSWVGYKNEVNIKEFLPIDKRVKFENMISKVNKFKSYNDEIQISTAQIKLSNAFISIQKHDSLFTNNIYTMIFEDITNLNYYDDLTNLPNRKALMKRVDTLINNETYFHLAFTDLDDFKYVNDLHGHSIGDVLLKSISSRLRDFLTENISIYRWGGDEFVIIFEMLSKEEVNVTLSQMMSKINVISEICDNYLTSSMSIGVANYPEDAETTDDLIIKSDMAMYMSKCEQKGQYKFYSTLSN